MRCPQCHSEIREEKKFCGTCGAAASILPSPVTGTTYCDKCGHGLSPGRKFCGICGHPAPHTTSPASVSSMKDVVPHATGTQPKPPAFSTTQTRVQQATSSYGGPVSSYAGATRSWEAYSRRTRVVSRKMVILVGLLVSLFICTASWYTWGVTVDLTTDPGGALVVLDGKPAGKTNNQTGMLTLQHVFHGPHSLSVTRPGFDPWSQPVDLGWFELTHPLRVSLPVPTFPLTVLTVPGGAHVQLDGQDVGKTGANGEMVIPKVPRGQHTVAVALEGYPSWSDSIWVPVAGSLRADLVEAAATLQREVSSHLERAQAFYQQRQYHEAIIECDEALRREPSNQQATSLKSQIQQTMSILGIQ